MEYALFSAAIQEGKTPDARRFLDELEHQRKAEYAAAQQSLGISKEIWALQTGLDGGDCFVIFVQSDDIQGTVSKFVESKDEFDLWFKAQFMEATGFDLNVPPPGPLSEILSVYEA